MSAFWRQASFCVVIHFTFCFTCSLLPLLLQTIPDMSIPSVDFVFCLVIITLLLCFVPLFSIFFPFLFLFHAPYCCFLSCPFFFTSFPWFISVSIKKYFFWLNTKTFTYLWQRYYCGTIPTTQLTSEHSIHSGFLIFWTYIVLPWTWTWFWLHSCHISFGFGYSQCHFRIIANWYIPSWTSVLIHTPVVLPLCFVISPMSIRSAYLIALIYTLKLEKCNC